MTAIEKLSTSLKRKDSEPDKKLAKEILSGNDTNSVDELIQNLVNANPSIVSDCLEVLEWVATEKPELVSPYINKLLPLVQSRNNRHVWSSLIVIERISELCASELWKEIDAIIIATNKGSVIAMDNGIKIMAKISG